MSRATDILAEIREVVPSRSPYEAHDGIQRVEDSFKIWRSLPEQIRADVLSIVTEHTIKTGDRHLRNAGHALRPFLEFIDLMVCEEWPVRPIMPGDPETEVKAAYRDRLEIELGDALAHIDALKSQLDALSR